MGLFDKLRNNKSPKSSDEKKKVDADKKVKTDETVEPEVPTVKASKENLSLTTAQSVILKPVFTEKSVSLQQQNKYTFLVSPKANKYKVKNAIKEIYGFAPTEVKIMNKIGKKVTKWGKQVGSQKSVKKAIITIPEGKTLNA